MFIPSIVWDICLEVYHKVAFTLYGIPFVDRSKYIKIDRHKLSRLKLMQKFNCAYCGYVNGLMAYSVAVAGETEKYWCGIKHQDDGHFILPEHQKEFKNYSEFE